MRAGGRRTPVQRPAPPADNHWTGAFMGGRRGPHVEIAQLPLTVILRLVMQWSSQYHPDCFRHL